jgi:hypothetical protein
MAIYPGISRYNATTDDWSAIEVNFDPLQKAFISDTRWGLRDRKWRLPSSGLVLEGSHSP